jgi:transcriptional regulator PpsR
MTFSKVDEIFSALDSSRIANLFSASSDVVLVVSLGGVVKDASFNSPELFSIGGRGWVGRPIRELVTSESEPKLDLLMSEAQNSGISVAREINHLMVDGDDTPVSYQSCALNEDGDVVLFGRDISKVASLQKRLMSAQLSMEREVSRLRNAETQYRAVFQLSHSPQLIVDAESLRILDLNAIAARFLGDDINKLMGKKLLSLFREDGSEILHKFLLSSIGTDGSSTKKIKLINDEAVEVSVAYFSRDGRACLVINFISGQESDSGFQNTTERKVLSLTENMPDSFVVVDANSQILTANKAFCDLVSVGGVSSIEGKALDLFFERPTVDFNVLMANLRKHGVVGRFASSMRTQFGQPVNVEIAACQINSGPDIVLGLWLRPTNNLIMGAEIEQEKVSRSNEQIANLVGHMPLKEIVRETTEMIEQLCIETALELTQDNRASAAQMLGVSRQSLYSKLGKDRLKDGE